jgi:tripartite-type tricarboxylate transporter receptor subunit TctC
MNQLLANENDNHTFLFSMDDMIYSNIALGNKNYEKFVGVNIFGTFYILMFGNSTSSTEKLKKQIANGTIINVGNAGFNGRNHLWSVNLIGLNVNAVSYKGVTPIVNDVLNGSLEYGLSNLSTFLPLVTEGKMQAVMVSSTKRLPHLPNVPTYLELGLRGDPLAGWLGYTARRDTSAEAIEKFGEAVRSVITPSNPKWQEYARRGIHLDNLGPRDANKFYETQIQDALKYKFLKHP